MEKPRSTRPWRVMVLDDDDDHRECVAALLACYGCRPVSFENGAEALRHAMSRPPDVAIIDLSMPEMDGPAVARAMREHAATKRVGLIALSGAVEPHWEIVRHFDAYLRKPIDPRTLPSLVESLGATLHARST